jgi:two-component system phosphate regulon sensor histidine kinase PhoR
LLPVDDLDMIVANLVGNAVKYNRDGGTVHIRAALEREWVRIDVADTGVGIAAEHVADVFSEFFREKREETRGLEGNGLGLAIAKRLVERAGGRLELTSEEGKGSTFSVFLPA